MKKIVKYFMMVITLCIFALTANSFSMAEASALYTPASYWNNDTNYPLAFSQNGVNRYVDVSSAKIIEQEEKVEENTKTAVFSMDIKYLFTEEQDNEATYHDDIIQKSKPSKWWI